MYLVFNSNYVLRGIHLDRLQSAYLCFTFDTASHKLTAAKRNTFNLGESTFKEGKSFSPASVFYDSASSSFKLSSSGSKISLYDFGFDFSVPRNFNPGRSRAAQPLALKKGGMSLVILKIAKQLRHGYKTITRGPAREKSYFRSMQPGKA